MTASANAGARSWTLRRRLLAMFAGAGVVAILVGTAALVSFVRVDRAVDRQVNTLDPLNAAVLDVYGAVADQETGLRGYALTHQRAYLAPYTSGVTELADATDRARQLAKGEPSMLADLRGIEDRITAWHRDYAEPVLATAATGQPSSTLSSLGKSDFDAIRANISTVRADLTEQRQASHRQLTDAVRARWIAIVVAIALTLLIMTTIFVFARRWVVVPLAVLAEQTRQVAGGDIQHRIAATGPAEITALSADVEAMRAALDRELTSVRDAEARVQQHAEALRRSNTELEQFAYVASHDLQEPLRKVASFCQLLQQRYGGQLDERADTYIEFAVDGAKRMQNLINDLLTFSRVGRTSAGRVEVDLSAVVARAERDLSAALEESGGTVTVAELPTVAGDAGLLTQLFVNLIGNGLKFRGEASPVVTIGCEREEAGWLLSVSDNGIGIESQYAEKIFVIFQRLHAKDAYRGTGIGLALCKKIIEYHGGRIWLDPRYRAGSRFCFTLPDDAGTSADVDDLVEPSERASA